MLSITCVIVKPWQVMHTPLCGRSCACVKAAGLSGDGDGDGDRQKPSIGEKEEPRD